MLKSIGYLHINNILDSLLPESHSVTSFHVDHVEYCLIKTVSMLSYSINAYNVLKSLGIFISILFRILDSLNHIQLPLFMLITLSIALLRRFLCFHILSMLIMCLNP